MWVGIKVIFGPDNQLASGFVDVDNDDKSLPE